MFAKHNEHESSVQIFKYSLYRPTQFLPDWQNALCPCWDQEPNKNVYQAYGLLTWNLLKSCLLSFAKCHMTLSVKGCTDLLPRPRLTVRSAEAVLWTARVALPWIMTLNCGYQHYWLRQSAALSMRYTVLKRQQRLYINTAKSPCMLSIIASTYKPTTGFPVRTLSVMICVWFWAPTVGNVKERLQCYIAKLHAVSGHQADAGMAALLNVVVIEYLTSWKSILPSLLLSWSWIMRLMSIRSQWSPFWWVTLAKSCSEISPSLSASSAAKLRSRISSFL